MRRGGDRLSSMPAISVIRPTMVMNNVINVHGIPINKAFCGRMPGRQLHQERGPGVLVLFSSVLIDSPSFVTSSIKLLFLCCFAQCWEQNHIANGFLVCHQHCQPINTDTDATGRRHAHLHGFQEILIEYLCFVVAACALTELLLKPCSLVKWIVEFCKGIA